MTAEPSHARTHGASVANVADVLPLLPLQRALLLVGEYEDEDPGLLQARFGLAGPIEPSIMRLAWQTVVSWHPGLRMSVRSPESGDPKAIVWKDIDVPWEYREEATIDTLHAFLEEDRRKGIDVAALPPWRITLIRRGDRQHELVWTCHHVFFDGWSSALVLEDVLTVYRRLADGEQSPSPPPERLQDFHLARSNLSVTELETWWRGYLAEFEGGPAVPSATDALDEDNRVHDVSHATVERLKGIASEWGTTDNAIVQVALAIALSSMQGSDDVVFGTTVSGRHLDVDAIDRIVGYLANTVPIRVRLDDDELVSCLIARTNSAQIDMQPYEHASLAEIHRWSGLPGVKPLFETLLVVENFPVALREGDEGLTLTSFSSALTTAYPVTIAVMFDQGWQIEAQGLAGRVGQTWLDLLVAQVDGVLAGLANHPDATTGELKELVSDGRSAEQTPSGRPGGDTTEYRLPVTQLEHQIASVWERVLGLSNVGIHQDYFDLGGTSILALRLFDEIESETGVRLPLRTILASPTVSGLASAAAGHNPVSRWQSLVPIQEGGSRTPLFCVHSGGGNALTYRDLARALGSDQPVYGLTAVGLNGETEPLDSIPDMARLYIEEIKSVQPTGPYRLLGHCFGGSVCLEMAHQLEARGETAELIVGIDASLPLPEPRNLLGKALRTLRARGILGLVNAAKRRLRPDDSLQLEEIWDGSPAEPGAVQDELRRRVSRANQRAYFTFEPPRVGSAKLIIRSEPKNAAEGLYFTFDWDTVGNGTEYAVVDADHAELLRDPWVLDVAKIIEERIVW